jgi:membrane associated rhomboid family serine protease
MFPIRDNVPSRTFPFVTLGLIVVNVVVFLVEFAELGRSGMMDFTMHFGLVPARLTAYMAGEPISAASVVYSQATSGVAWWAHIGGFLGGILVFRLFRPRPKVYLRATRRPLFGR